MPSSARGVLFAWGGKTWHDVWEHTDVVVVGGGHSLMAVQATTPGVVRNDKNSQFLLHEK